MLINLVKSLRSFIDQIEMFGFSKLHNEKNLKLQEFKELQNNVNLLETSLKNNKKLFEKTKSNLYSTDLVLQQKNFEEKRNKIESSFAQRENLEITSQINKVSRYFL